MFCLCCGCSTKNECVTCRNFSEFSDLLIQFRQFDFPFVHLFSILFSLYIPFSTFISSILCSENIWIHLHLHRRRPMPMDRHLRDWPTLFKSLSPSSNTVSSSHISVCPTERTRFTRMSVCTRTIRPNRPTVSSFAFEPTWASAKSLLNYSTRRQAMRFICICVV